MINFNLNKEPKGVTIIEGFPGFGLVSTIAIEFLLEHLKAENIGEFLYDELSPMLAIHKGKLVKPMGIFYVKKYNLVILHTTLDVKGYEWEVSECIKKLAAKLKAKEIISLEGVQAVGDKPEAYTFNNHELQKAGAKPLQESVIVGVSAALMLDNKKVSPLFAGAKSHLPDAEAAAKLIEVLDKYLGLEVDFEPLVQQAHEFEDKLKSIMKQSKDAEEEADRKRLNYLG
ncbi:proteasome assembly chaperone family protein [Nanoarchaeota archaeon]